MNTVYIGLGSNMGNRKENLAKAMQSIQSELNATNLQISSIIESEPWGFESTQQFLNMCVRLETNLRPREILETLKSIEKQLGRTPSHTIGYTSRIIDLDILLYNQEIIEEWNLTIPHPHLHVRDFVLIPLHEIAPNEIHPKMQQTIDHLLKNL